MLAPEYKLLINKCIMFSLEFVNYKVFLIKI